MNIYLAIFVQAGYDVTSENLELPFWELDRDTSHVTSPFVYIMNKSEK